MKIVIAFLLVIFAGLALASPNSVGECHVCLEFVSEALQELIEIIGNVGIGSTCKIVCDELAKKTSNLLGTICDLGCEFVGIEEFIKLIDDVDPDPIYICERFNSCPHSTTAAANIVNLNIEPHTGQQGGTFDITLEYQVTNEIATGSVDFQILPPAGMPFGDGEVVVEQQPATYGVKLSFQATPNEEQPFSPGQYTVQSAVCEGTCGSKHEWTKTLATRSTNFTITG
mmetsp:Transcript_117805/g.165599  ORF Transcript_117805/g.165599 Transcript_117805/m.165599 type:complete len:228 (-) Transcript_117805:64-747(-)